MIALQGTIVFWDDGDCGGYTAGDGRNFSCGFDVYDDDDDDDDNDQI